jgi:hypothetical protein
MCIDSARTVQRLLSPIQLEPRLLRSSSSVSKFRLSGNRRSSPHSPHTPPQRRRRHCQRDCGFECMSPTDFFDNLPWISALKNSHQSHHSDIADLSQLNLRSSSSCSLSGPGPVRRRRTSSRSSPLTAAVAAATASPPKHVLLSPAAAPPCRNQACDSPLSPSPRTPLARFSLSHVRFEHLLPVFSPVDSCKSESVRYKIFDTD